MAVVDYEGAVVWLTDELTRCRQRGDKAVASFYATYARDGGVMSTSRQSSVVQCQNCGASASGKYCSQCGAELNLSDDAYQPFVETFLKIEERKRYLTTYLQIIRSPVKRTIALFEDRDLRAAYRFLEISSVLYTLLVLSRILAGGLLAEITIPLFFVITWSVTLLVFYRISRRRSHANRTFREFMGMASYYLGFCLPIPALLQLLPIPIGSLLLLLTIVPLCIYAIKVWGYFWRLPGGRVFSYLFVSSILGSIVGGIFLGLFGVLVPLVLSGGS